MIHDTAIKIRSAASRDRTELAKMLHFEPTVHRHLDWRTPLDWIGYSPYLVAENERTMLAAMACPPDPPGTAWVRLFAHCARLTTAQAWELLWPECRQALEAEQVDSLWAIPLQDWFENLLMQQGFSQEHEIILLVWDNSSKLTSKLTSKLPQAPNTDFTIRKMTEADLEAVQEVDEQAFGLAWLNSIESTRMAFRQAHWATVAENADGILGYQISTHNPIGAHLARLAVLPGHQRRGIGSALVNDIQHKCTKSKPCRISVNTQDFNHQSLALYEKTGFRPTGEKYPVYTYHL